MTSQSLELVRHAFMPHNTLNLHPSPSSKMSFSSPHYPSTLLSWDTKLIRSPQIQDAPMILLKLKYTSSTNRSSSQNKDYIGAPDDTKQCLVYIHILPMNRMFHRQIHACKRSALESTDHLVWSSDSVWLCSAIEYYDHSTVLLAH